MAWTCVCAWFGIHISDNVEFNSRGISAPMCTAPPTCNLAKNSCAHWEGVAQRRLLSTGCSKDKYLQLTLVSFSANTQESGITL